MISTSTWLHFALIASISLPSYAAAILPVSSDSTTLDVRQIAAPGATDLIDRYLPYGWDLADCPTDPNNQVKLGIDEHFNGGPKDRRSLRRTASYSSLSSPEIVRAAQAGATADASSSSFKKRLANPAVIPHCRVVGYTPVSTGVEIINTWTVPVYHNVAYTISGFLAPKGDRYVDSLQCWTRDGKGNWQSIGNWGRLGVNRFQFDLNFSSDMLMHCQIGLPGNSPGDPVQGGLVLVNRGGTEPGSSPRSSDDGLR